MPTTEVKQIALGELHPVKAADGTQDDSHHGVLSAMDNQKFSCYHVKAILVSGVGFLTDAYDLFSINLVVPMISIVYFDGKIPPFYDGIIKGSATIGTLLGQIVFGILADIYGRKTMYGIVLQMMIIGTFASTWAANTVRGIGVVGMLVFWRFVLGIGIGGDYPLSATITSEYANTKRRGQMMAAVFSMQGFGILLAAIVALITLSCFKTLVEEDPLYLDYVWRICLGFGIVPATAAIYFRHKMPETPRYTMQVKGNLSKAARDVKTVTDGKEASEDKATANKLETKRASFADFRRHFGQWKNFKVLFGCAACWFLLDIAFYGLQLNQSDVLKSIGYTPQNGTAYEKMFSNAAGNALISMMGTVPGYWATVALIEIMGRTKIQYLGFAVLTTIFIILSAAFNEIKSHSMPAFIALYCIALFFFNFGPNTTTFIIPGEVFPTRYRSTGHGISAASGKLAAFISSLVTPVLYESYGMRVVLGVFAVFMGLGLACTYFVPETKNKSLENLAGEEHFTANGG